MDTLTHTMYGAVCGLIVSKKIPNVSPWNCAAVGATAGLFPDLDFVFNLVSPEFYLRNHRAATHSLLLAPFFAMCIALLFCSMWKFSSPIGNPFATKESGQWGLFFKGLFKKENYYSNYLFVWFSLISLCAILTHIFMDYITSFGTMFMWPFTYHRYEFSSIFIIDFTLSSFALAALLGALIIPRKSEVAALFYLIGFSYITFAYIQKFNAQDYFANELAKDGVEVAKVTALPAPGGLFNWSVIAIDKSGDKFYKTPISLNKEAEGYDEIENPESIFDRIHNEFKPLELKEITEFNIHGDEIIREKAKELFQHPEADLARWFFRFPVVHAYNITTEATCVEFKDLRFDSKVRNRLPFVFSICENKDGSVFVRRND